MQETKLVRKRIKHQEVVAIVCDRCKRRILGTDWIECQEMLRWSMRGGYGSLIGDGEEVTLDLCQKCTQAVLGEYLQHKGNVYFPETED